MSEWDDLRAKRYIVQEQAAIAQNELLIMTKEIAKDQCSSGHQFQSVGGIQPTFIFCGRCGHVVDCRKAI